MCGIAGGYNLESTLVEAMVNSIHHRGPDGVGEFHHRGFSMGMARLAILDVEDGQQPFSSACGRYQVTFNGEIYNWAELRLELKAQGHRFRTQCDGEVLPAGWQAWGADLFPRLNGMFAIAIYDTTTEELIIARDPCGQKPLYYAMRGHRFTYASEVRALQAAGISLSPNRGELGAYLMNRYVSEPETMFREVKVFPAAHWARVTTDGKIKVQRYWAPDENASPSSQSLPQSLEELDRIVKGAVTSTIQRDWKSAIYLSSGVDSNLLAKYASDSGAEVSSISLGFHAANDETKYAEQSAKIFGIDHHNVMLDSSSLEDLPRVVQQMERPVGDALILAFDALASKTREVGAKVAYGAEGIDEHFGGYSFHQAYLKAQKLGGAGRWGAQAFLQHAPDAIVDRLANFPASLGTEGKKRVASYLKNFRTLSADWRADYLRFLYEPRELDSVMAGAEAPPTATGVGADYSVNQLLARQYKSWLQDWSLIRQDKNTMAHSIEYRSPFLDPALIRYAFNTREDWKITGSKDKWLWRKLAEQKLPPEIAWRPKVPFYLPLEQDQWREKLIAMSHDILTPASLSSHGWIRAQEVARLKKATDFLPLKKLASLLIFQLWYNTYF